MRPLPRQFVAPPKLKEIKEKEKNTMPSSKKDEKRAVFQNKIVATNPNLNEGISLIERQGHHESHQ